VYKPVAGLKKPSVEIIRDMALDCCCRNSSLGMKGGGGIILVEPKFVEKRVLSNRSLQSPVRSNGEGISESAGFKLD
jgi:hypothetical protein